MFESQQMNFAEGPFVLPAGSGAGRRGAGGDGDGFGKRPVAAGRCQAAPGRELLALAVQWCVVVRHEPQELGWTGRGSRSSRGRAACPHTRSSHADRSEPN